MKDHCSLMENIFCFLRGLKRIKLRLVGGFIYQNLNILQKLHEILE